MKIADFDTDNRVMVVAEIGNNHEGSFTLAQEMVGLAAEAGADAVKFQTIVPEFLINSADQKRIEQLRKYQLSYDQFERLSKDAEEAGVVFLSTPFDIESARFLNTIQPAFKIASGDNTFFPMIDTVAEFSKPMIISTGLADIDMVRVAHDRVAEIWKSNNVCPGIALLHCVVSYPTPKNQANLGAINTLKNCFPQVTIGYSDHTLGIDAAIYSVAAGARIVEKHFTIDKNYSDYRDHQLSVDPDDLRRMVAGIREVNEMLGSGEKYLSPCETDMKISVRRSVATAADLPAGTIMSDEHIVWVRPGTGLPPGSEVQLFGKKTLRFLVRGELIALKDVE